MPQIVRSIAVANRTRRTSRLPSSASGWSSTCRATPVAHLRRQMRPVCLLCACGRRSRAVGIVDDMTHSSFPVCLRITCIKEDAASRPIRNRLQKTLKNHFAVGIVTTSRTPAFLWTIKCINEDAASRPTHNRLQKTLKNQFAVGIVDDVTHSSFLVGLRINCIRLSFAFQPTLIRTQYWSKDGPRADYGASLHTSFRSV